jgi:hypothetical protein
MTIIARAGLTTASNFTKGHRVAVITSIAPAIKNMLIAPTVIAKAVAHFMCKRIIEVAKK